MKFIVITNDLIFDLFFDAYAQAYNISGHHLEYLRIYTNAINLKETYCDVFSIKELQEHLEELMQNYERYRYHYFNLLYEEFCQICARNHIFNYFTHFMSLFALMTNVIPSFLLTHLFYKQLLIFSQDIIQKTFILDMSPLEMHDFTQAFAQWLLKNENAFKLMQEMIKHFL